MPRLCLITITCMGEQRSLVRSVDSTCAAVIWALQTYPRACRVSARVIGPSAHQERRHATQ